MTRKAEVIVVGAVCRISARSPGALSTFARAALKDVGLTLPLHQRLLPLALASDD